MDPEDEISRKQVLILQIEVLKHNLAESEQSWAESRLTGIRNTVAESIRRDIVEKEALLGGIDHPNC